VKTTSISKKSGPILVVDDDAACCELICAISAQAGYESRVAVTGPKALDLAREVRPAAVIAEVLLPVQSGYELCRSLREEFGEGLPILLISGTRTEPLDSTVAFLVGADDYLKKPFEPEEMLARLRRALVRATASPAYQKAANGHDLTAREYEILSLLASGLSQTKISEKLVISSKTVATHIQRILGKLGVHSRAEAIALAYRTGFLTDAA
jgi:DNA-binding NarL/FixJ family response regulator